MAKLTCKDGTEIQISDETENSLREAFESSPPEDYENYEDANITVKVNVGSKKWPIDISTDGDNGEEVSRNVEDTEAFIVALQTAVAYCKKHNLGV